MVILFFLSKSKYYYLSMIAVLFPTFTLLAIFQNIDRENNEIKRIMLNGIILSPSLLIFMFFMYILLDYMSLSLACISALLISFIYTFIILKFYINH